MSATPDRQASGRIAQGCPALAMDDLAIVHLQWLDVSKSCPLGRMFLQNDATAMSASTLGLKSVKGDYGAHLR